MGFSVITTIQIILSEIKYKHMLEISPPVQNSLFLYQLQKSQTETTVSLVLPSLVCLKRGKKAMHEMEELYKKY